MCPLGLLIQANRVDHLRSFKIYLNVVLAAYGMSLLLILHIATLDTNLQYLQHPHHLPLCG